MNSHLNRIEPNPQFSEKEQQNFSLEGYRINVEETFTKENIITAFDDQANTRRMQNFISTLNQNDIDYLINQLKGTFRFVIKNKNGNYFCSSLISVCNREQRLEIIKELSDFISEDCNDEFGTYPIQKLIENSSTVQEYKLLISSFDSYDKIVMASMNKFGNYVIQKIITYIPENQRTKFNLLMVKFACVLSKDGLGSFVITTFIQHTKDKAINKELLDIITTNFIYIAQNKYGNYLIQILLKKWWNKEEGRALAKIIKSKYQILKSNPYSVYITNFYDYLCCYKNKFAESK